MDFGILENFRIGVKGVSVGFKGALFSSTELRPSVRIKIDGTPLSVSKFFSMSKVFWLWTKTLKKIYQSYKLVRLEKLNSKVFESPCLVVLLCLQLFSLKYQSFL